MSHRLTRVRSSLVLVGALALAGMVAVPAAAQRGGGGGGGEAGGRGAAWDPTLARGKTRDIDFTTSEGTWTAVDISPDGQWIAFDLLGHIYRVPAAGGDAQSLTQNAGVSINFQPRFSPDGKSIAFISDRSGQYNLWIMNADGSNPHAVFTDLVTTAMEPAWTPDGQFIIVKRGGRGGGDFGGGGGGLWMYSKDGGAGVQLVGAGGGRGAGGNGPPAWPSPSADGKYLYYFVTMTTDTKEPISGSLQVRRVELKTGEVQDITAGESNGPASNRISSGGGTAPEISPDGRWLAFARQIPDGTILYKGHKYGPRTALWIRDMKTGGEKLVMDPIEPMAQSGGKTLGILPRYHWAADGKSIVIMQGGKIRRLDVASGAVATIPFTATVHRTISEMARKEFRITDDPVKTKFIRWPSATADGSCIVFQALGHVYIQDSPGAAPRRVTATSFSALEYAPSISPDGRWITFATWDDSARGNIWRVATAGGVPSRVTKEPGDYTDPVWSPDGKWIVAGRGEGATARNPDPHAQRLVRRRESLAGCGGRRHRQSDHHDQSPVRIGAHRRGAAPAGAHFVRAGWTPLLPRGARGTRSGPRRSTGPRRRWHGARFSEGRWQRQGGAPHLPVGRGDHALAGRRMGRVLRRRQRVPHADARGRNRWRGAAYRQAPWRVPGHAAHAGRRALPALA